MNEIQSVIISGKRFVLVPAKDSPHIEHCTPPRPDLQSPPEEAMSDKKSEIRNPKSEIPFTLFGASPCSGSGKHDTTATTQRGIYPLRADRISKRFFGVIQYEFFGFDIRQNDRCQFF